MKLSLFVVLYLITFTSLAKVPTQHFEKDINRFVSNNSVGYSVLISQPNKLIYQQAQGLANIELQVPMQAQHIFEIGSLTKQFTAVAILLLAQEGKLSLEDNINSYIPDISSTKGVVKIKHLLAHTSGLVDPINEPEFLSTRIQEKIEFEQLISQFKNDHWLHPAGERINYSNVGYSMLAWIIEQVTGVKYETFLQQRIFDPLHMKNTSQVTFNLTPNKVTGYTFSGAEARQHDLVDLSWAYAAADLQSTTYDLSLFIHALMQGKILNQEFLTKLLAPLQLNDSVISQGAFTYSLSTIWDQAAIRMSGSTLGYSSHAIYLPDSETYVVVLSNSDGVNGGGWIAPSTVAGKLLATHLSLPIPSYQPISIPDSEAQQYLGSYQVNKDTIHTLSFEDGQFYYQRNDGQRYKLTPMGNNSFFFADSLSYLQIKNPGSDSRSMDFYYFLTQEAEQGIVIASPRH